MAESTAGKRPRLQQPDASEAEQEEAEAAEAGNGVAMAMATYGGRVGVAWFEEGQVRRREQRSP